MRKIRVILNNIRSNENVGSIFRTCDATLVDKIILAGYTPAPLDRFGRENKKLAKSALGAESAVGWQKEESLFSAIEWLRLGYGDKIKIVAVEQDEKAIDYRQINNILSNTENLALVFGNEVSGLSEEELELCDAIIQIPMKGKKESLNVSVAAGIVLFSLS